MDLSTVEIHSSEADRKIRRDALIDARRIIYGAGAFPLSGNYAVADKLDVIVVAKWIIDGGDPWGPDTEVSDNEPPISSEFSEWGTSLLEKALKRRSEKIQQSGYDNEAPPPSFMDKHDDPLLMDTELNPRSRAPEVE